jgi:hypothetical protein
MIYYYVLSLGLFVLAFVSAWTRRFKINRFSLYLLFISIGIGWGGIYVHWRTPSGVHSGRGVPIPMRIYGDGITSTDLVTLILVNISGAVFLGLTGAVCGYASGRFWQGISKRIPEMRRWSGVALIVIIGIFSFGLSNILGWYVEHRAMSAGERVRKSLEELR